MAVKVSNGGARSKAKFNPSGTSKKYPCGRWTKLWRNPKELDARRIREKKMTPPFRQGHENELVLAAVSSGRCASGGAGVGGGRGGAAAAQQAEQTQQT